MDNLNYVIEDTDTQRNNEEAMKAILEAFNWVGLNYDGEVEYQSKRLDIYKKNTLINF